VNATILAGFYCPPPRPSAAPAGEVLIAIAIFTRLYCPQSSIPIIVDGGRSLRACLNVSSTRRPLPRIPTTYRKRSIANAHRTKRDQVIRDIRDHGKLPTTLSTLRSRTVELQTSPGIVLSNEADTRRRSKIMPQAKARMERHGATPPWASVDNKDLGRLRLVRDESPWWLVTHASSKDPAFNGRSVGLWGCPEELAAAIGRD
jgi:hypothetical protein